MTSCTLTSRSDIDPALCTLDVPVDFNEIAAPAIRTFVHPITVKLFSCPVSKIQHIVILEPAVDGVLFLFVMENCF